MLALIFPYLWVGTPEDGYQKVWLHEVDYIEKCDERTSTKFILIAGCHHLIDENLQHIELLSGHMFDEELYFCYTVWDHEWFHAMGYTHETWPRSLC